MIYLDFAATTPPLQEVQEAMLEVYRAELGNPSSLHTPGQLAKQKVAQARDQVARLINADPEEVIFTSGGTESNNTVMHVFQGKNIAISAIEHPSVTASAQAYAGTLTQLPVDQWGFVRHAEIPANTDLVSIMLANNEVGSVQNLAGICKTIKSGRGGAIVVGDANRESPDQFVKITTPTVENSQRSVVENTTENTLYVHTDATQAIGKIPVDVKALGVDYLTFSAHKIGGPVGVGALFVRRGAPYCPLILGGHQENGRRAGTTNTASIVGLGVAAGLTTTNKTWQSYDTRVRTLRDWLKAQIIQQIPHVRLNSPTTNDLPHILNVSFAGAEGEAVQLYLDLADIAVSTGSACAAGSLEPSPVMMAIHHDAEVAHGSVRFSLGLNTTRAELEQLLQVLPGIVQRLQGISTVNLDA